MKNRITLLITLLISISTFAQQGINYKAVVKDTNGDLIAGQEIDVKFSIIEDTGAAIVYVEDHPNIMTDANGIIILNIGEGDTTDDFSAIDWGSDTHSLKTEIDLDDDGTFENLGTTPFKAVPYALHAESANFKTTNNITSNSPGDIATDDFVFGSAQLDNDATTSNDDSRLFFDKSKGAFRAGQDSFGLWDDANVGSSSTAIGWSAQASAQNSSVFGSGIASGIQSTVIGGGSASELNAMALANGNASASGSIAIGDGALASGDLSIGIGVGVQAESDYSTAMGYLNLGGGGPGLIGTDPLFEIGNGTNAVRSNALTILKNGTITAPSFDLSEITDDKALVTKEYFDTNSPEASSGLEQITEEAEPGVFHTGWRLKGVNPDKYGPIGTDAVDLSINDDGDSNTRGATGIKSISMGYKTTASETYSTSLGLLTVASAKSSTAMGTSTVASGNHSTAIGKNTTAPSYAETAIGSYNSTYIPNNAFQWDSTDRLFVIGAGSNNLNRKNALTVYKNGTITAPSFDLAEITDDKALVTKEYVDASSAGNINDLDDAVSDSNNVGLGVSALNLNTSGTDNTALGIDALFSNSSGIQNTAVGRSALWNNTSGDNNIAIGFSTPMPSTTGSNQIRIGNANITYAGIQVGWTITSDKRWKDNIRQLPYGLDMVMQLQPVDYTRKNNEKNTKEMGFIAQDLEELLAKVGYIDQGFLTKDDDGFMSVRYNDLIALLTKAIQEQQMIIDTQTSENAQQNESIQNLVQRMNALEAANN